MLSQSRIKEMQERLKQLNGLKDEVFVSLQEAAAAAGPKEELRTVEILNTLNKGIEKQDLTEIMKANEQLNQFRNAVHNQQE